MAAPSAEILITLNIGNKMANNLFVLVAVMAGLISNNAQAADKNPLKSIQQTFADINEMGMEHYYLKFHIGQETEKLVKEAKSCAQSKNFKKATGSEVATDVRDVLFTGLDVALDQGIIDMDDGWYSAHESIDEKATELGNYLNDSNISICKDVSIPEYSDGQTITVVLVDGKTSFAYLVARPD